MKTLLIISSEEGLAALTCAQHMASQSGRPLCVLCVQKASERSLTKVGDLPATGDQQPSPWLAATLEAVDSNTDARPAVYDCRGPRLHRAVLDAANELDAAQLVIPMALSEQPPGADGGLARRLTRSAPYDVLLLAPGGAQSAPNRVLVPQRGGKSVYALKVAMRAFGGRGREVKVIPDPHHLKASVRNFNHAREHLAGDEGLSLVEVGDEPTLSQLVQREARDGDLVLFDTAEPRELRVLLKTLQRVRQSVPDMQVAIGITRAADAAGAGRLQRALERVRYHLPTLSRDERKSLYERLEAGAGLSADFMVMLTISAAIAALGLIQNSTAVVIGAMLVAPLMTPLVATGMALTQHNYVLFRSALRASLAGVACALVVTAIIGALSPWTDLSAEVVARGSPNLFDLGVALLSGMAAAYALARPGLAGTLVGVAIAVALVPPLAAVGIALAHQEFRIAAGALTLFVTNFFAIIVGAALVFQFFESGGDRTGRSPSWVRSSSAAVAVGLAMIAVVLGFNLVAQTHEGVQRPYSHPLSPEVRHALREIVARYPGLELLQMSQSVIEHGFGIQVVLASRTGPQPKAAAELRQSIVDAMGTYRPINIHVVEAARSSLPGAPELP